MDLLVALDQNITYEKNILKEKEMTFSLERETEIKDIEDLDIQIEGIKKQFSMNLEKKKEVKKQIKNKVIFYKKSLDVESNEIRSLTSLQNHLIQEQRKNMDYLIINKLLANKKGKRLSSPISNRTTRNKGKKTHRTADSILIKQKHLDGLIPNITHEDDHSVQTKGPVSPFPLTKMPSSSTKSSHITSPTSASTVPQPKLSTSSSQSSSKSSSSKISTESTNNSTTTTGSASSMSSSSISAQSNYKGNGTVPNSESKTTAIGKIKPSTTSNLPEITNNTGKTKKNRFKEDDQSYYTDYSDFNETDPKDMMFFDSE